MSDKKFNIGKPELPDEEINKHKDFKKLMYNYHTGTSPLYKTPLYKNKKVFLVILIILLMIFVIGEIIEKDEKPVNTQQTK